MKRTVLILLFAVASLVLLGSVSLYSSTTWKPSLLRVYDHLRWVAAGAVCCAATSFLPYPWLRRFHIPKWLLVIACLALAATLIPGIGVTRNGATRWLPFGQPSEFTKLALILFLADYCATHLPNMRERTVGFLRPSLSAGLVGALIFLEPDWGTTALVAVVTLGMLAVAGAHWGYLFSAGIMGAEVFALLLLHNPLRLQRFMVFLDPEKFRDGTGWQGWHAMLALGSGGPLGTFLGAGSHKNGFVPEQQTDFVLSLLGEELGFAGTALILFLFVIILLSGIRIAWKVSDPFGQFLAFGITLLIGVQAFINIGVVTSSLPNKGIALPFVSYGGSSTLCMLTCLGLLISVARHGPVPAEYLANDPAAGAQPNLHPAKTTASPPGRTLWRTRLHYCP